MPTPFRLVLCCLALALAAPPAPAQAPADTKAAEARAKSDADIDRKAAGWVASLALGDDARAARVQAVIAMHLKAVRDWHNSHPAESVPAGLNPATGQPLSNLERQMIADAAMPREVHTALMQGLRADLTEPQVEAILDKYTIGKVEFTLRGYRAIVPDLTAAEEAVILGHLRQAREEAVDYKNMNQISAVFEVYKTKCEQYLNANGRDWRALYKAYVDAARAKKAAEAAAAKP